MHLLQTSTDPIRHFQDYLEEARTRSGLDFPNAMSLATADSEGRPSVRVVLLKEVSQEGFVFFTNLESRKGKELKARPRAALCVYWERLGIQVRVEGETTQLRREEAEAYFRTRPLGSRLGAWASPQSREIPSRAFLENLVEEARRRFPDPQNIPLPPHWGGYCLAPERIEFWKNGPDRLHDRLLYRREGGGPWTASRLAP